MRPQASEARQREGGNQNTRVHSVNSHYQAARPTAEHGDTDTSDNTADIRVRCDDVLLAGGGSPGLPAGAAVLLPLPGPGDPGPHHWRRPQSAGDAPPHQPQGENVLIKPARQ